MITIPSNRIRRRIKNQSGWALISTLLVVALIAVVVISMLSIAILEVRTASNVHHVNRAKANARMALMIAAGELQKYSGQDQSITSTAGIMDDSPSDHVKISNVSHPRWTGVFESDPLLVPNTFYTDRPEAKFKRWLVSLRDPERASLLLTAKESIPEASAITLLGEGTLGALPKPDPLDVVRAETIEIDEGAYAWWVGDESVKARITLDHPESLSAPKTATRQALLQSAPLPGTLATEALAWIDPTDEVSREQMEKVLDRPSLALHADYDATAGIPFHDFTMQSMGVPADVRDGGLKWDMSRLFSDGKLPYDFIIGTRKVGENILDIGKPLYDNAGDTGAAPDWQRLADYHNLYRLVNWDGDMPYISYDAENWNSLRTLGCGPPLPVISRIQVFYSLTVGRSNRLALVIEPVITFWNPYNVEIRIPENKQIYMRSFWHAVQFEIFRNGTKINYFTKNRHIYFPRWPNTNMKFVVKGLTLKPGETKVCSDSRGAPFDWNRTRTTWGHSIQAQPGWENKGGLLGDGYGYFGQVSPGQQLNIKISTTGSHHTEFSHWGQRHSSIYHQMDLLNENGLWHADAFKSLQAFRIKNQSASQFSDLVDSKGFTRNNISTSQLYGNKIPLCVMDLASRTEMDGPKKNRTLPYLFTSPTHGSVMSHADAKLASTYWSAKLNKLSDWDNESVEIEPGTNRGFHGSGNTAGTGENFVTAREIPTRAPLSLVAYRNFDLLFHPAVFNAWGSSTGVDPAQHTVSPAYRSIIGNSYAHPLIPRNQIKTLQPKTNHFHDHPYLANHALYDRWFHSGIPAADSSDEEEAPLSDLLSRYRQFPNPRLVAKTDINVLKAKSEIAETQTGYQKVSKNLFVRGAFNVNSTSPEAWKSVLASMRNLEVPVISSLNDTLENQSAEASPYPRYTLSNAGSIDQDPTDLLSQWQGYRQLADDDIATLANAIVEQVKIRGPFFSMADFVNRRTSITGDDANSHKEDSPQYDLSRSGTIQAAIDSTDLNTRHFTVDQANVGGAVFTNPDAAKGTRAAGAAGYLTQGDILQGIGSILTARGDTFTIRTYGESRDKRGETVSRAWCEAVVQRHHDFIDPSDDAPEEVTDNLENVNLAFGRRYRVVSFRWLRPDEI